MCFTQLHCAYLWLCYLYEVMSVCQGLSSRTSVLGSSNNNFQELRLVFSNCTLVTLAYSNLEKTSYSLAAFGHES